MKLGPRKRMDH